jgi:hypothetical protein
MITRRVFLSSALSAVAVGSQQPETAGAAEQTTVQRPPGPLVWPVVTRQQPGIPSIDGHTDTVPDIVGRIGTPASLVIFTEGNHLMVLLSEDIVGAFPSWAKLQPQYADLDLENVVVVTVPQPLVVQMIHSGGIALGNLTLDVSRKSGFYPDIVMGGPDPLQQLRKLRVLEPQARFLFKESRPRASCSQRQSARYSPPHRCSSERRTSRATRCRRSGGPSSLPYCSRRTDRKVRG